MSHRSQSKQSVVDDDVNSSLNRDRDRHYTNNNGDDDSCDDSAQQSSSHRKSSSQPQQELSQYEIERKHTTALLIDAMKKAWSECSDPFPSKSTFLSYLHRSKAPDVWNDNRIARILEMNNIVEVKPHGAADVCDGESIHIIRQNLAKELVKNVLTNDHLQVGSAHPVYWIGQCPLSQLKSFFPSYNAEVVNGNQYYPSLILLINSNFDVVAAEIVNNGADIQPSQIVSFLNGVDDDQLNSSSHSSGSKSGVVSVINNLCCGAGSPCEEAFSSPSGVANKDLKVMKDRWTMHSLPPHLNLNMAIPFYNSLKRFLYNIFIPSHEECDLATWTDICRDAIQNWRQAPDVEKDLFQKNLTFLTSLSEGEITAQLDPVYAYKDGLSEEVLRKFAWE